MSLNDVLSVLLTLASLHVQLRIYLTNRPPKGPDVDRQETRTFASQ